jgi:hypothetical protein
MASSAMVGHPQGVVQVNRQERLKALQLEYWELQDEFARERVAIRATWTTAPVQEMRRHALHIDEINHRLDEIRELKSFTSLVERDIKKPRAAGVS